MKIHDKDPATGMLPICPPTIAKRRRPSAKRRLGEDENGDEPPSKKVMVFNVLNGQGQSGFKCDAKLRNRRKVNQVKLTMGGRCFLLL